MVGGGLGHPFFLFLFLCATYSCVFKNAAIGPPLKKLS